jgi:opacity protein-like surface antigen
MKAFAISFVLAAGCARADLLLDVYAGKAFNYASDVTLREPAVGTDLTFDDVSFADRSFERPPYWGSRLSYVVGGKPTFGAALDFIHAKAIVDTSRVVRVHGRWRNEAVDGNLPIRQYVSRLELSHGNNLFLLEGLIGYRPRMLGGRAEVYGGAGTGPALIHVEVTTPTQETFEYQWDWCWGVLAGGRLWLAGRIAAFGEYKYTRGGYDMDLADGAVAMTAAASHVTAGLAFKFL